MTKDDRVESLKAKHAELEVAIDQEATRPHPDDIEIAHLKKLKLAIKDEIASIGAD